MKKALLTMTMIGMTITASHAQDCTRVTPEENMPYCKTPAKDIGYLSTKYCEGKTNCKVVLRGRKFYSWDVEPRKKKNK